MSEVSMRHAYTKTRLHPLLRTTSVVTALAFYFSLGAPYVVHAQEADAPVVSVELTEGSSEEAAADREAWNTADRDALNEEPALPEAPAEEDRPVAERALPSGEAKSAVTPQAISLPKAEGSIEGMGESFMPSLSAGTATFSVPIALPKGRAGVQPSLELTYGTSAGNGPVGIGWSLAVPYIARQTDKGLPRYVETAEGRWHEEEDTFIYNGGQELVPVDSARATQVDGAPVPIEFVGWQQYRARVEGMFMRFFRSPDGQRWVVQDKSGSRFDFGALPPAHGPTEAIAFSTDSLMRDDDDGGTRIFSWGLTRMSDSHGSTVYYRYEIDQGQRYLSDIYYVSPATCAAGTATAQRDCAAPLDAYGRHIHLVYEDRDDAFDSFLTTWRVTTAQRLRRIEITAFEDEASERSLVRRYHLGYDQASFLSLLQELLVEGRPETISTHSQMPVGDRHYPESALDDAIVGAALPPMRFGYTQPAVTTGSAPGFSGINALTHDSGSSPPHSMDEARTDLFDVNSDGLPDIIVTDPARYRTDGDEPAVGVFFNGFSGPDGAPTEAGEFSQPISVAIPVGFSNVMHLGNLNIAPMDIDGDGRSDLLHMPRTRTYGYFTPVREVDGPIPAASPAYQGYRFARVPVELPNDAIDPRIDLGRDGRFIKALDVDNDSLIDIVQSTGTGLLTWLNLGRYPKGEGRFGSATWNGDEWELSTEPLDSCLLQEGLPLDFEDSQVRLGDMNGDGLQDIIKIRQGRLIYWPGRGPGLWGIGPATCARGEGEGREIEMLDAPDELNAELDGVFLADLNHDGADDVVQVRFDAVDVWWNRAGLSFTDRVTAGDTPYAPSFTSTVRFADIDGTGTTDIVYGRGGALQWIDPMGGQKPRLLNVVENGLGSLTEIEYGSSAQDYLRDLRDAEACVESSCERFTWSFVRGECDQKIEAATGDCARRSGSSPVISTVVRATNVSDQFQFVGREETTKRIEYAYHDGYYEGIEQEFRGFGAADARALGEPGQPTSTSRTHFHQGSRRAEIASDRLADNPDEALKGRERLSEIYDDADRYLATKHAAFTVRELLRGMNGVSVSYAFVHRVDELRYDTAPFVSANGVVVSDPLNGGATSFEAVRREIAGASLDERSQLAAHASDSTRLPQRGLRYAHLVSTTDDVDNAGNVRRAVAYGRVRGELGEAFPPELVVSHTLPTRVDPSATGAWLWRTAESYQTGHGSEDQQLHHTVQAYNTRGDVLRTTQPVTLAPSAVAPTFAGDLPEPGAAGYAFTLAPAVASAYYDGWGNPLRACNGADIGEEGTSLNGCLRYSELSYDSTYAQFVATESVAVDGPTSNLRMLVAEATWDQGLSGLLTTIDANRLPTSVEYDGMGRFTSITPPNVRGCEGATVPTVRIRYELAVQALPVSTVTTHKELSCAAVGADAIETRVYIDGLGRARATVTTAEDPTDSDAASKTQRSDIATFYSKGGARETFQADIVDAVTSSIDPIEALALPSTPSNLAIYDAFDRQVRSVEPDLSISETRFHALSRELWDALDLDPASVHYGTPSIERSDGHGRIVDRVLRNRQMPGAPVEFYRMFTTYRADGVPTEILRTQTVDDRPRGLAVIVADRAVSRTFTYDSRGRRIAGSDPNTNAAGQPAASRSWRYLFNRVDDLIAVRDPRGCGQNFFYDRAGRLIGEDYVRCTEAQVSGETGVAELPIGAIADTDNVATDTVDVRYYFDDYPEWLSASNGFDLPPVGTRFTLGRATAIIDRAQRTIMASDERGNVAWQARQVAVIPSADSIANTMTDPPSVDTADAVVLRPPSYDAVTYVRETSYDHAGRVRAIHLPEDPDHPEEAPRVVGVMSFNARGLPSASAVMIDDVRYPIVERVSYTRDGLPATVTYGDDRSGERRPTVSTIQYDSRRRPERAFTLREPTDSADEDPSSGRQLGAVTAIADQRLHWDRASNLVAVDDLRDGNEWRDGFRPASYSVQHDALYRVTNVELNYTQDSGQRVPSDGYVNYRTELETVRASDPMRGGSAPRIAAEPEGRVASLVYEHDWLGNSVEWTDDASQFLERSIGQITNGAEVPGDRPSALRIASNLPELPASVDATVDRGGYVEADYGVGGNLTSLTAHAQCRDRLGQACHDGGGALSERRDDLREVCACASEQHFQYRWDELNRLVDARRYDRASSGDWTLSARQRYRYDAANQRIVKQVMDITADVGEIDVEPQAERIAVYVYPGDFERRGLVRLPETPTRYGASDLWGTETQYLMGGARVVAQDVAAPQELGVLNRDFRVTVALPDLLQSTSAAIDLASGSLIEASTYYPNGARESYRAPDGPGDGIAAEPAGFTGKEGDDDVGLTYFGERYLVPRIGRWASPDPLNIHAAEGGEANNAYHYVSGNFLQARDPLGLDVFFVIFYARENTSFEAAAATRAREIEQSGAFDSTKDVIVYQGVKTKNEFKQAWQKVADVAATRGQGVKYGAIYSHASTNLGNQIARVAPRSGEGELEFAPNSHQSQTYAPREVERKDNKGSLGAAEIAKLPQLPWTPESSLDVRGCRTGITDAPVAKAFRDAQQTTVRGEQGFSSFSTVPNFANPPQGRLGVAKPGETVYLKAYYQGLFSRDMGDNIHFGLLGMNTEFPQKEFTPNASNASSTGDPVIPAERAPAE